MRSTTSTEETDEVRSSLMVAVLAGVVVTLALSAGALIVASGSSSGSGGPQAAGAPVAAPSEVRVDIDEMDVRPGELTVAAGGSVEVVNVGAIPHDLVVEGHDVGTPMLDAGESYTFDTAELQPGVYTVLCTVPGHREAGMQGTLNVVGDGGSVAHDHEGGGQLVTVGTTYEGTLSYDPNAAPPDGFVARDPRLPPAPDQNVHELEIRATQIQGEVAPGVTQELWTFDDLVPGPSENSSFHVIGTIFDTVYKEGSYRLHPDRDAPGGGQALDLQPAQGGFVEFTFDVEGFYPFVTHKFSNVPRGAVGVFLVGDVDPGASH